MQIKKALSQQTGNITAVRIDKIKKTIPKETQAIGICNTIQKMMLIKVVSWILLKSLLKRRIKFNNILWMQTKARMIHRWWMGVTHPYKVSLKVLARKLMLTQRAQCLLQSLLGKKILDSQNCISKAQAIPWNRWKNWINHTLERWPIARLTLGTVIRLGLEIIQDLVVIPRGTIRAQWKLLWGIQIHTRTSLTNLWFSLKTPTVSKILIVLL